MVKGLLLHSVLQKFFDCQVPAALPDHLAWALEHGHRLLLQEWKSKKKMVSRIGLTRAELKDHYDDCDEILSYWIRNLVSDLELTRKPFSSAFSEWRPLAEHELSDSEYEIKGIVDAIEHRGDEVWIIDYKTSERFDITKEQRLQLSIYAWLYWRNFNKAPDKVGAWFLREKLHLMTVDGYMLKYAGDVCAEVHEKTKSKNISDYPQNVGYLCQQLKGSCPCHSHEEKD